MNNAKEISDGFVFLITEAEAINAEVIVQIQENTLSCQIKGWTSYPEEMKRIQSRMFELNWHQATKDGPFDFTFWIIKR